MTQWTVGGFSVHGVFQERIPEWVPFPSSAGLPDPGIEPGSPELQAKSTFPNILKPIRHVIFCLLVAYSLETVVSSLYKLDSC